MTRSAGSTRWCTTRSRCRRSRIWWPWTWTPSAALRRERGGGPAPDQAVRPALWRPARGSVVMINSMVVRFSQRRMGPYKLAKAALLAMAQSLATELGPQGIRVNSVAPGHIWGDSLKWYFGYLARKRGVDIQQIYDETAAGTDLRRLPEPDEIADAVVFLASPHGPRDHRPVPGRQLRRVPPLSAVGTASATCTRRRARLTGLVGLRGRRLHRRPRRAARVVRAGRGADPARGEGDPGPCCAGRWWHGCSARRAGVASGACAAVRIERPVFVTGLPRTGTTALHRLLAADPAHQGLELWLAEAPQPRPPRSSWAERSGLPAHPGGLRPAPRGASRVHGGALHRGRPGGGVLAAAAAVDAFGLLRVPGAPAGVLGVAARTRTGPPPTCGTGATCS